MKKFTFSLSTVKGYKDKLLGNLKIEHAAILAKMSKQKELIKGMEESERLVNSELNERNSKGIAPHELVNYQRYLRVLQNDIKVEYENLAKLQKAEEEKREELLEMKKETASFEKLEEKKLEEYNVLARKEGELFIEEFVSNKKYAKQERR
ncbi:MAG: flagellar FliJ family protein [Clostridiales bacterium]|nr:flagellar FliJ family protein [Clostridiales bacterium]